MNSHVKEELKTSHTATSSCHFTFLVMILDTHTPLPSHKDILNQISLHALYTVCNNPFIQSADSLCCRRSHECSLSWALEFPATPHILIGCAEEPNIILFRAVLEFRGIAFQWSHRETEQHFKLISSTLKKKTGH